MDRFKLILEDLKDGGAPDGPWLDKMVRVLNGHMEQAYKSMSGKLQIQKIDVEVTTRPSLVTLTPINGWAAASGFNPPSVEKLAGGHVSVEGRLTVGTSGTVALQVPADYYPSLARRMPLVTPALLVAEATVDVNGAVSIVHTGLAGTTIDLDGLAWPSFDQHPSINSCFPIRAETTIPKVSGVLVAKAACKTHPHVGNALGVEWHMDGKTIVIDTINGLVASQTYTVTILVLGDLG